jgi:aminoglycoside phosphotransferase (APT) family kinase protein
VAAETCPAPAACHPCPARKRDTGRGLPLAWHWSVYRWLAGENATIERIADPGQAARDLAQFIAALQRIDPTGGPLPGPHNFFRGEPLTMRDAETRDAIASLHSTLDTDAVTEAWEAPLQAPSWDGLPIWIHGDLSPLNLLIQQGRLSAVIDFGCLGVGDPACELQVAWNLLSGETRGVFRAALGVDDAMWTRGRGWALSVGLIALPYYLSTNPILAGIARRAIDEVLADQQHAI